MFNHFERMGWDIWLGLRRDFQLPALSQTPDLLPLLLEDRLWLLVLLEWRPRSIRLATEVLML